MSTDIAIKAMELNEEIHEKNGITIQGGKKYGKVVHRVEAFRRVTGYEYGVDTKVSEFGGGFIAKAVITDSSGRVIGSGHAFATKINAQKALEKLETTAVGRALSSLGLGGDEYASMEEIESYQERYEPQAQFSDEEYIALKNDLESDKLTKEVLEEIKIKARAGWSRMIPAQQEGITKLIKEAKIGDPV